MTIIEAQRIMEECDKASFFVKDTAYLDLTVDEIIAHNCLHLLKANAKIADYLEKKDHSLNVGLELKRIIEEVIPDLFIYSLQFSNALEIDLESTLKQRIDYVINKYK